MPVGLHGGRRGCVLDSETHYLVEAQSPPAVEVSGLVEAACRPPFASRNYSSSYLFLYIRLQSLPKWMLETGGLLLAVPSFCLLPVSTQLSLFAS